MTQPTLQEWLFSAKTFAAAMLALSIGLSAGLDRPYWAMATVYVSSQPLSGATRSKAVFRLAGTLLGAAAAVVLVPNLANSPEVLSFALASWASICVTVSLLDRTPRGYVFTLAGFTAAIVGFPSVAEPGAIWDTAIARSEEIGLGIVCASLVASLVFPRNVGPVITERTEAWLRDGRVWTLAVLDGIETPERARVDRRRLAADAVELGIISTHLAYDPSLEQQATRAIRALHARMLLLLPVLSSISDRLAELKATAGLSPSLQSLLVAIADWLREGSLQAGETDLNAAIIRQEAVLQAHSDWIAIMQLGLIMRLRELLDLRRDCQVLQDHIAAGRGGMPKLVAAPELALSVKQHRDLGMAVFSGMAVGLSIGLVCLLWISTAWPEGAIAVEMTAIASSFFAARDNPTSAILSFLCWTVVAVIVDMAYLFAVLPVVNGFEMLVIALAPAFIVFGLLIARPSTASSGVAVALNAATLLSLQETYSADFAAYVNAAVATMTGMGGAVLVAQLIRSFGAETGFRRMARANWRDLARAARRRGRGDQALFATLLLDRLGLAAPRLSAIATESTLHTADFLADLRIGLNILDLRRARHLLPQSVVAQIDQVLDGVGRCFDAKLNRWRSGQMDETQLLAEIDQAISSASLSAPTDGRRQALLGLVGIRRGLFPKTRPYLPQLAEQGQSVAV